MGSYKPTLVDRLRYRLSDLQVGNLVTWSTVSRLSDNPWMRATTLIPLLGFLILFNERTVEFFSLSEEFARRLGVSSENRNFELSTLYFTYFGLCFLGLSSIALAIFCPTHIRNQPHIERYVETAQRQESAVIAKSLLRETIALYWKNTKDPLEGDSYRYMTPNITGAAADSFSALVDELHQNSENFDEFSDEEGGVSEEFFERFMIGPQGRLNTDAFAEVLWARRHIEHPIWREIDELAKAHIKDIAYTHFRLGDVSRIWARLAVILLLGGGGLLLLIPTVRTFILLLYSLF